MRRERKPTDWIILRASGPRTLKLAVSLQEAGMQAWTPVERVRRRMPRCKATEHLTAPLAPTYVFARACHLADLQRIERMEGSPHPQLSIFRYYGETVFVPHQALHSLRRIQQDSYVASLPATGRHHGKPRATPYQAGDRVVLKDGPLAGLDCYVEISDGLTTTLALTLFGRHAGVKMKTLQLRANDVSPELTAA